MRLDAFSFLSLFFLLLLILLLFYFRCKETRPHTELRWWRLAVRERTWRRNTATLASMKSLKRKRPTSSETFVTFLPLFFPDSKWTDDDDVICEKLCGVAPTSFGRGEK
jgi:hypothetical protein